MSDIPTSDFAPKNVQEFMRTASIGEIEWYLSRGEPQCIEGHFMEAGELVSRYYPGLRGVAVGEKVETPEEALDRATKAKQAMLQRKDQFIPFDEGERNLDSEGVDLQKIFEDNLIRLENIVHIGTMQEGSLADPLEQMIERFDESDVAVLSELPYLRRIVDDEDAEYDDIIQVMRDNGHVGFLVEASVPEQEKQPSGTVRILYGTRKTNVYYGSNFGQACKKAIAWAKRENENMRNAE